MSAEGRILCMIKFSGKKSDWKSRSVKFLAHRNQRDYKKQSVGEGKTIGVDKVCTELSFRWFGVFHQFRMKL